MYWKLSVLLYCIDQSVNIFNWSAKRKGIYSNHERPVRASELNDPLELAERFTVERKKESLGETESHQTDKDFIEAMEYGMPPTSGIGPGIDRLVMLLADEPNIKEVIAFPKTASATDPMTDAPSEIDGEQLDELHLRVVE